MSEVVVKVQRLAEGRNWRLGVEGEAVRVIG